MSSTTSTPPGTSKTIVTPHLSNLPPTPLPAMPLSVAKSTPLEFLHPKDPEGFLRRCCGISPRTKLRCSTLIGHHTERAKDFNPTLLPTCRVHSDQKSYAGRCTFNLPDGQPCRSLFRWLPGQSELCSLHQDRACIPSSLMALPLELRLEIFRYLIPTRAIGSSTSLLHVAEQDDQEPPGWFCLYTTPNPHVSSSTTRPGMMKNTGQVSPIEGSTLASVFPTPLLNLLLVSRQMYAEVKDLMFSTVPFTIDVRKDGTFMCGRRLLEPRRPDGSSHFIANEVDNLKNKFLITFDWASVRNYNVNILVEKWEESQVVSRQPGFWDEEVEIYDMRDYVAVVVSGILAKSRSLCKLNVRLGLSRFPWKDEELLKNIKAIVGPFERLRNVRQPRFRGVYDSSPHTNFMISLAFPAQARAARLGAEVHAKLPTPLCSVPQLPARAPLEICIDPSFIEYRAAWEGLISSTAPQSITHKPPIRNMFTQFKVFYSKLCCIVPTVMQKSGRNAFLHRARVAREQEDVEAFRALRNELIEHWHRYSVLEAEKKEDMEQKLHKMLRADTYPPENAESEAVMPRSTSHSPLLPNREYPTAMSPPPIMAMLNAKYNSMLQQPTIPSNSTPSRKSSASSDPSTSSPALHHPQMQQAMALNTPPVVKDHFASEFQQFYLLKAQSQRSFSSLYEDQDMLPSPPLFMHGLPLSPQYPPIGAYPGAQPPFFPPAGHANHISPEFSFLPSFSAQPSPTGPISPMSSNLPITPTPYNNNIAFSSWSRYGSVNNGLVNNPQQTHVLKHGCPSSPAPFAHRAKRHRVQDRTDSSVDLDMAFPSSSSRGMVMGPDAMMHSMAQTNRFDGPQHPIEIVDEHVGTTRPKNISETVPDALDSEGVTDDDILSMWEEVEEVTEKGKGKRKVICLD